MLSILLLCKQTAKCSQFFRLFCSFFLLAICMQHMVCLQQSHICTNYYYVTSLLIDIFWDQVDPSHWSKYYSSLKMYAHGKASTKTKDVPIETLKKKEELYYIMLYIIFFRITGNISTVCIIRTKMLMSTKDLQHLHCCKLLFFPFLKVYTF